jgi:catechol 2,3-dioxygenase
MPSGTTIGHVHLHVGNLAEAAAFYSESLGFDRTVWEYPGALFFGAGGYHHHLGTNIWAGTRAEPPTADDARLLEWTIELPDAGSVAEAAASLAAGGFAAERVGADVVTRDPWGTAIRIRKDAGSSGSR